MRKGCQVQQNRNKSSCGNLNISQVLRGVKLMRRLILQHEFLDFAVIRVSGKDVEKTAKCEFGICEDNNRSMFIPA